VSPRGRGRSHAPPLGSNDPTAAGIGRTSIESAPSTPLALAEDLARISSVMPCSVAEGLAVAASGSGSSSERPQSSGHACLDHIELGSRSALGGVNC